MNRISNLCSKAARIRVLTLVFFIVLSPSCLLFSKPAVSQEADFQTVDVQVIKMKDYLRFIFSSEEFVAFTPTVDGGLLILDFTRPNNINLSELAQQSKVIRSFGASPDGRSIVIRLHGSGIKLRRFVSDGFANGFDIFFEKSTEEEQQKVAVRNIVSQTEPIEADFTEEDEQSGEVDVSEIALNDQSIITYPLNFVGPPRIEQMFRLPLGFVGPPPVDFTKVVIYEIIKTYQDGTINGEFNIVDNGLMMIFPFEDSESQRVASVRFDDQVLLTFADGKKAFLQDLPENTLVENVEILEDTEKPVISIKLKAQEENKPVYSVVYRNKFSWVLELTTNPEIASSYIVQPLKIKVEDNWGENKITAVGDVVSEPITVQHPHTGESIKLLGVKNNSSGVTMAREFVDLQFYPTLQGFAIQEKSDFLDFKFDPASGNVAVTKLPNLFISDEILTTDFSATGEMGEVISKTMGIFPEQSIFPFPVALKEEQKTKKELDKPTSADGNSKELAEGEEEVEADKDEGEEVADSDSGEDGEKSDDSEFIEYGEEDNAYEVVMQYLHDIIKEDEGNFEKKYELAKYYFAKSMYPEAQGMLYNIMVMDSSNANIQKIKMIYAASLFLNRKYEKAQKLFSELTDESLNNAFYNELKLWKWLSSYKYNQSMRNDSDEEVKIDFIASYDKFMQQYPEELRYEFGLSYIARLVAKGSFSDAKNVLDMISYSAVPENFVNDTKYFNARIMSENGEEEKAYPIYKELSEKVEDRRNRARGTFRTAKYDLINNNIAVPEAIEKMMFAATVWRDDFFEMDILETVGNLYLSQEDYLNALQTWQTLVMSFPQTTESVFVLGKMKDLFIELFDGGIAYEMEPLESLRLYFKFRELLPVGDVGDRITRKVAQFFLEADMVEDAIETIQHQINYRSSGDEKAKLILWLAEIFKENRDPNSAYNILSSIDSETVSEEIMRLKKYSEADALSKMNKYQESLEMVMGDYTYDANTVKLDLFYSRGNWFGIINIVENRFDVYDESLPNPLSRREVEEIMMITVSYAAQNEKDKMDNLVTRFRDRIENAKDIELFDYLTSGTKEIDHRVFEDTVELSKIEKFINEYSFLPSNDWGNVIEVLESKVQSLVGQVADDLTRQQKMDIARLGLAYTLDDPGEDRFKAEQMKKLAVLSRDFKDVRVDRFTIDAFSALDNTAEPIINDAVFEGRIKLLSIPEFIPYYEKAIKISDLNISIRGKFEQ